MANKKLGLFWGKEAFSFVESAASTISKTVCVPFKDGRQEDSESVPDEIRLPKLLEDTFTEQQFAHRRVSLSLPTKDLIFRSFVIPWMEPQEIPGVIEFEVTKYIPLKLSDLVYTYHTYSFEENKLKNLRVLFVAVHKETLGKYKTTLQNANIEIASIEPAAVSLCRLLRLHKILKSDQTTAILDIHPRATRIIFFDKDVIHFVRESVVSSESEDLSGFCSRIITDLRVSFNFFARQNNHAKLRRILVLSNRDSGRLCQEIKEDFDVPITTVPAETLIKKAPLTDMEQLYAYGATLKDSRTSVPQDFNLLKKRPEGDVPLELNLDMRQLRVPAITALVCAMLFFLVMQYSNNMAAASRKKAAEWKEHLGSYQTLEVKDIDKLRNEIEEKLKAYRQVRLQSEVSYHMHKIPAFMPEGMWLDSFKIFYADKPVKGGRNDSQKPERFQTVIELQGYVYRPSANEQFQVINDFYASLRTAKEFKSISENMDLKTRKALIKHQPVSAFTIVF